MAYVAATATVCTTANRRVAMRIGHALTVALNLPFSRIGSADLKDIGNGTGNIALSLIGEDRLAYVLLRPHARPFKMSRPDPALRFIEDPEGVAALLANALANAAETRARGNRGAALKFAAERP
jgi:hypothetical protein